MHRLSTIARAMVVGSSVKRIFSDSFLGAAANQRICGKQLIHKNFARPGLRNPLESTRQTPLSRLRKGNRGPCSQRLPACRFRPSRAGEKRPSNQTKELAKSPTADGRGSGGVCVSRGCVAARPLRMTANLPHPTCGRAAKLLPERVSARNRSRQNGCGKQEARRRTTSSAASE